MLAVLTVKVVSKRYSTTIPIELHQNIIIRVRINSDGGYCEIEGLLLLTWRQVSHALCSIPTTIDRIVT